MSQIHFFVPGSKTVWNLLETASVRSHHDTHRVFDDFLTMSVCALAGGTMEAEYLKTIEPYVKGEQGRRAVDALAEAFGALVNTMEESQCDVLGDIFEGAITFGEHGQFFTPEHLCTMMAQMTMDGAGKTVSDPACGSGRNLLAAAKISPRAEFYGKDIDLRCVHMTAINLALHNLYGWVVWGNSLAFEQRLIYRTGFNGTGVIAKVEPVACPEPAKEVIESLPPVGTQMVLL